MSYFKIGNNDFSNIVSDLKVNESTTYTSQTNANGDSVVDLINKKRTIEVGIIPLTNAQMINLQTEIDAFNVSISFTNPKTGALESINCIIPTNNVEYYTIQANKVMFKAFKLKFIEL